MSQITALLMNFVAPGVWAASELTQPEIDLAAKTGHRLLRVDLAGASDKTALMDALARDLELPEYFGKNFDALEECLGELPEQSIVVLLNGTELWKTDPKSAQTLNDIFTDAAIVVPARSYVWVGVAVAKVPAIPQFWSSL